MNYSILVKNASKILDRCGIEDSLDNAREILLDLLDIDMAEYLYDEKTDLEEKFSKNSISELISRFDELIDLRANHFPLQYIKGYEYFCGLKFLLDENVLIPRADTETLVEAVLSENTDKNKNLLDMCTGSGCIAVSLASLGKYKLVVGTDISDEALNIAAKNAEILIDDFVSDDELNNKVYFYKSDMFTRIPILKEKIGIERFDIITINPPYIKTDVINTLQDEVKKFEPIIALDGDKDGLRFYRIIAKEAKNFLSKNGRIYLEIGYDQADEIKKLFKNNYKFLNLYKDLSGNDRVLSFENIE